MTQEMLIMAAILVAVILLTFIGILSRYRKCKSDEVLVVYGKTGGEKKSGKFSYISKVHTVIFCKPMIYIPTCFY